MKTLEEKRIAIDTWQRSIDTRIAMKIFVPLVPHPYCCVCFDRLNEHNIHEDENGLIDVCLDCKDK